MKNTTEQPGTITRAETRAKLEKKGRFTDEEIAVICGRPPLRGTVAWDYRENLRREANYRCISLGRIEQ